ncbi:GAF domain-containing sensor histidine kinase [uncultured Maribacter sp.]|uniref:GAF domain-containing sensor histidine kinase n=1 Tax=uncultured Maribacter sp. TaxID=431308 RepID=UPI00262B7B87|nr:GAF domain-containing sensor histidine kinase [uncultured Maribacter sp.]
MITVPKHINEIERLNALRSYAILDTPPQLEFDNLTKMASEICQTPISLINFVDATRVWSKSNYGLEVTEAPREKTFCTHVINNKDGLFIIPDSRVDIRFKRNPYVEDYPNIVFYASFPILSKDGIPIGNLCVIDNIPRKLTQQQIDSLKVLTDQAMHLLEYHKSKKINLELEEKNNELESFAYIAAHDLKAPLNNIYSLSSLLSDMYLNKLDEDGITIINHIKNSSNKLKELINGVLEYSKSPDILKTTKSHIKISHLQEELIELLSFNNTISLTINSELNTIYTNKSALDQILLNLIENAIKYNDKDKTKISIGVSEENEKYLFYVQDNGPGIAKNQQEKIFDIFKTISSKDKYGQKGNGIGLATVKKLIEKMGGKIHIKSNEGEGCKFVFSINKN